MKKSITLQIRDFLGNNISIRSFLVTLFIFIIFTLLSRHMASIDSLISIVSLASLTGIVACGITLLMIGGEFDLSVGSIWGLSSVFLPVMVNSGIPAWGAVLIVLFVGAAIGLLHGVITVKVGIPSFIVTLAGMKLWRTLAHQLSEGTHVSVPVDEPFFRIFSFRFSNGINVSSFWFIGVVIILAILLQRTQFGNWIFATGGNKLAAKQSGVPVERVKIILFVLTAVLASLAGIIQTTQFSVATSQTGKLVEMYVIAMAVIGGNRLFGGYGSVIGTVFGVIAIAIIQKGLILTNISSYWFQAFVGIVILVTVVMNTLVQRRATGLGKE